MTREITGLFHSPFNANVISESWFVPVDDGRAVPRDDPNVSWTVIHSRGGLVPLQDSAVPGVAGGTHVLTAVGRANALDVALDAFVAGPSQQEAVEHHGGVHA